MRERRANLAAWADDPALDPVRTAIDERIAQGKPVSLVLIALSRVDIVNAAYGRPAGDALITAVGDAIAALADAMGARFAALGGVKELLTYLTGQPGTGQIFLLAKNRCSTIDVGLGVEGLMILGRIRIWDQD